MPFGMEVGLRPSHIVLDGDPAPTSKKGHCSPPHFTADVYCGQMAGWIRISLGGRVIIGHGVNGVICRFPNM